MTLEAGFIIADSAVIGRLIGLAGSPRSMMTTWEVSPTFSLMHMYLSDSMVRLENPIWDTLIPTFWSYREREKKILKIHIIATRHSHTHTCTYVQIKKCIIVNYGIFILLCNVQ